jgi:hypothetical protein
MRIVAFITAGSTVRDILVHLGEVRGRGHVIHWETKTPRFTFPENGIVIHDDTAREFDGGHTAEQGKKFQLNDKSSFRKAYPHLPWTK